MYSGHLGNRHANDDTTQLFDGQRPRTEEERKFISILHLKQAEMRDFLLDLPIDVDGRAKSMALTKLDELCLWAKVAIDK